MTRARAAERGRRLRAEPVIALINVVFLLLVFFLIAGTLAPPPVPQLVAGDLQAAAVPSDALVLHADGRLTRGGVALSSDEAAAGAEVVRLMPHRDAEARRLVEVALELREAGAARVLLVGERGAGP